MHYRATWTILKLAIQTPGCPLWQGTLLTSKVDSPLSHHRASQRPLSSEQICERLWHLWANGSTVVSTYGHHVTFYSLFLMFLLKNKVKISPLVTTESKGINFHIHSGYVLFCLLGDFRPFGVIFELLVAWNQPNLTNSAQKKPFQPHKLIARMNPVHGLINLL